ncbi:hypothetical protein JCM10213_004689 [Rhodosporidiobolus nylandii]
MERSTLDVQLRKQTLFTLTQSTTLQVRGLPPEVDPLPTFLSLFQQLGKTYDVVWLDVGSSSADPIYVVFSTPMAAAVAREGCGSWQFDAVCGVTKISLELAPHPGDWPKERSLTLSRPDYRLWFKPHLDPHGNFHPSADFVNANTETNQLWAQLVPSLLDPASGYWVSQVVPEEMDLDLTLPEDAASSSVSTSPAALRPSQSPSSAKRPRLDGTASPPHLTKFEQLLRTPAEPQPLAVDYLRMRRLAADNWIIVRNVHLGTRPEKDELERLGDQLRLDPNWRPMVLVGQVPGSNGCFVLLRYRDSAQAAKAIRVRRADPVFEPYYHSVGLNYDHFAVVPPMRRDLAISGQISFHLDADASYLGDQVWTRERDIPDVGSAIRDVVGFYPVAARIFHGTAAYRFETIAQAALVFEKTVGGMTVKTKDMPDRIAYPTFVFEPLDWKVGLWQGPKERW